MAEAAKTDLFDKSAGLLKELCTIERKRLDFMTQRADISATLIKLDERRKELFAELDECLGRAKKKQPPVNGATGDGSFVPFRPKKGIVQELLKALDDLGTGTREEIGEELTNYGAGAIWTAIKTCMARGCIEQLKNGSYALTEAQQKAMRAEAEPDEK